MCALSSCVYVMVLYFVFIFEGVWGDMCCAIIWTVIEACWFAKEYSR